MYYFKRNQNTKMVDTVYKMSMAIGILLIVAAYPLSFVLPVSVSYEDGPLENLQVVALILGSIYNFILMRQSTKQQSSDFHLWSAVLMLFMTFRELNWGRVFYDPYDFNDKGPVFVGMKDFDFQIEAYITIALFIIFLLTFAYKRLPIRKILRCPLPRVIIFFMVTAMIFSFVGDVGLIVGRQMGQIVEECAELAFYVMIPALCIHYRRELAK